MRNLLGVTALACWLGIAGFAVAQTATGDTAETSGEPAATDAPDDSVLANDPSGLSLGRVEGEAQVGDTYIKEEHGDWELRCVKSENGKDPCLLYQLLRDGQDNSVAEFNMFPLPEGGQAAAGANIVTPLETLLTANLRLGIDGGKPKVYPYSFCSRVGCVARIGLTAAELDQFRKGAKANVIIVPAASPDATVTLSLSLTGFTAGYNALVASAE